MLLAMCAQGKALNSERQYPIHVACEMGNIEAVKVLLEKDLYTTEKDANGHSPYDYALKNEYQDILDEIIRFNSEKKQNPSL